MCERCRTVVIRTGIWNRGAVRDRELRQQQVCLGPHWLLLTATLRCWQYHVRPQNGKCGGSTIQVKLRQKIADPCTHRSCTSAVEYEFKINHEGDEEVGLKTSCDSCGQGVVGVFSSLKKIDGRYLCAQCATNPTDKPKYYCNACHNFTPTALKKGSGWIELVLYLFYILPGIIYSIWRRSGAPNVCPLCRATALVPAARARPVGAVIAAESRDEVECTFCAEKILARAKNCKHCGKQVRA